MSGFRKEKDSSLALKELKMVREVEGQNVREDDEGMVIAVGEVIVLDE